MSWLKIFDALLATMVTQPQLFMSLVHFEDQMESLHSFGKRFYPKLLHNSNSSNISLMSTKMSLSLPNKQLKVFEVFQYRSSLWPSEVNMAPQPKERKVCSYFVWTFSITIFKNSQHSFEIKSMSLVGHYYGKLVIRDSMYILHVVNHAKCDSVSFIQMQIFDILGQEEFSGDTCQTGWNCNLSHSRDLQKAGRSTEGWSLELMEEG